MRGRQLNIIMAIILCVLVMVSAAPPLPTPLHAQTDTDCNITLAAPTEQYVLPSVNGGSFGLTDADALNQTPLGIDPTGAWFLIVVDPDATPLRYAWLQAQAAVSRSDGCDDLPVIDPNNVQGSLDALADDTTDTANEEACMLSAVLANIRAEPSTDADVVGEISNGVATVVGRTEDSTWYEVRLPDGRGWVAASASSIEGDCTDVAVTGSTTLQYEECPANYVGFQPSRLSIGDLARVLPGDSPQRVRALPQLTATILFQMQPSSEFVVIGGPQCGDGIVWWNIQQGARTGWTAESDTQFNGYYVEPIQRDNGVDDTTLLCDPSNTNYRTTRMRRTDDTATITDEIPSLILFTEPDLNSPGILEIPGGESVDAVNVGPRCNQNAVWWNVTYNAISGWVVESSTNDPNIEYYLIPPERPANETPPPSDTTGPTIETTPAPADVVQISRFNAEDVVQLTTLDLGTETAFDYDWTPATIFNWMPDSSGFAIVTTSGVQFYDFPALVPQVDRNVALQSVTANDPALHLTLDNTGQIAAIGHLSGNVTLFDLTTNTGIDLQPAHAAPISAIDFSPDNTKLLTASGAFYDTVPEEADFSLQVFEFSPDVARSGDLNMVQRVEFPVTMPVLTATFAGNNVPVVVQFQRVAAIDTDGAVLWATGRADATRGMFVQPAGAVWDGDNFGLLFGSGPAVAYVNVRDGAVLPRPIVLADASATVWDIAEISDFGAGEGLIAAYMAYPEGSGQINGVRFISLDENSGQVIPFIALADVYALDFAPNNGTLAIVRSSSVEFWAVR